jgi:NAD(P)-dependent dehydrogenase (short-subunit alcohol dehydrogenase family)
VQGLSGKTAVVTGGASGIGRAMAERFGHEGMQVVVADVEQPVLEAAVSELRSDGLIVTGVLTDVSRFESVVALADAAFATYGAVHVLCNNAGVGSGSEGHMWDYELNDWAWAMGVNVWGVIHGVNAFVPRMLAQGDEGHVVNTSSANGGVSPLPSTPIYALTKAAVVTLTECLHAHLQGAGGKIKASVLFPGPHMLKTGLWTSWRNRPAELAKERPRTAPYPSLDDWEQAMKAAGLEVEYTPVEEVAARVVRAIREEQFWILPEDDKTDDRIGERAKSMLERANPTYLAPFILDQART